MRALLLLCPLVVATSAFAKAADAKGFFLKTAFEYQTQGSTTKSETEAVVDANNTGWTTLVPPKNGVTLLARMTEGADKIVNVEYMVVDTNKANPVFSSSSVQAKHGQKAQIEVAHNNGERVSFELTATPANQVK